MVADARARLVRTTSTSRGDRTSRNVRGHLLWAVSAAALSIASATFLWQGRWLVGLGSLGLAALSCAWYLVPGRRLAFAFAAIALSVSGTMAFVAGVDLYLHHRFASTGGYNIWGYRGEVVGRRTAGDRRVEFLGGSVAFGYGVAENETIPFYVQQNLRRQMPTAPVTVINLGWNSEGAHSFRYTLRDYVYLKSDAAILYSGYNDLGDNNQVFRHQSAVFRLTGYLPILPIIPLREWLHVDNLSDTAKGKIVFTPGLTDQYATEAADTALRISQALEQQLGKLARNDVAAPAGLQQGLDDWQYYLAAVHDAVVTARVQGLQAIVVTEPYVSARHVRQQAALARMLETEFANDPRVRYLNAGRTVDLHDRSLCYDGMHLTVAGNRQVAAWLAPELQKVLH